MHHPTTQSPRNQNQPYESGDAGGIVTQPPHPRGGHSAAVVGGRYMYIFGGNTLTESFGDCWRLDLEVRECECVLKEGGRGAGRELQLRSNSTYAPFQSMQIHVPPSKHTSIRAMTQP